MTIGANHAVRSISRSSARCASSLDRRTLKIASSLRRIGETSNGTGHAEWMPVITTRPPLRAARIASIGGVLLGGAIDGAIHAAAAGCRCKSARAASTSFGVEHRVRAHPLRHLARGAPRGSTAQMRPAPATFRHAMRQQADRPRAEHRHASPRFGRRRISCECIATASGSMMRREIERQRVGNRQQVRRRQVDELAKESRQIRDCSKNEYSRKCCGVRCGRIRSGSSRSPARARRASPGAQPVTPGPVFTTVPAGSWPSTMG